MKKMYLMLGIITLITSNLLGQLSWKNGAVPEQNQSGTIVFNATGTPLANASGVLYAHTGVTVNGSAWQNVIGTWGNNSLQPSLTKISANSYELSVSPSVMAYYGVTSGSITKINMVVRNAAGNAQTADLELSVGSFDMSLTTPLENSTTIWSSGTISVQAQNTGGAANYVLKDPLGTTLNSATTATYSYAIASPVNGQYTLSATQNSITIVKKFNVILNQNPVSAAMPANLKDGVNYHSNDFTKATLVLNAQGKDFVYVAGNFNNWSPTSVDVMKKDAASGKFWLEVTGLQAGNWYAFQYWVCDNSPVANSPAVVKTADPFSTLVLSPFDDPEIVALGVFPGLPLYDTIAPNEAREVSVIQTGNNAYWQYNWVSSVKPNSTIDRKDLVIYEVLVRDFDAARTYQDLINRINYFKDLNINAIQLMPVMEFEGNLSWGYNPVYHLAPDKRYGTPAKLKELIDICHQNGIAVILDIALNHVFGRSPLERMWMLDTDGDGWSNGISPDNPYCNVVPLHTANVGADLNHFREPENLTNTYVTRTIEEWINEYRIDGFRWDLTQGFTNSCTANDGNCTGSNLPDRIGKLQWYADKQWEIDPYFYVIFEHWAFGEIPIYNNYRLNETPKKGVMCWRRADYEFADLLKGNYAGVDNTTDAAHFRIQGNMESHDEERIVYKAINEGGQTSGNLNKTLARMPAAGAMFFLVPGPKMIWHFAELGWDLSINTCNDGTVSNNCRLDTKPQPQWTQNWMGQPARKKIYDDWSKMIALHTSQDVLKNGQHAFNLTVTGRPRLDVWTSTQPSSSLSYIMVHANFSESATTFPAYFPYTGTWYNLLDNTPLVVTSTTQNITLPANGGYVVYGNAPNDLLTDAHFVVYPTAASLQFTVENPAHETATIFYQARGVSEVSFNLYSVEGRLLQTQPVFANEGFLKIPLPSEAGVYFLEMATNAGRKTTRIMVY